VFGLFLGITSQDRELSGSLPPEAEREDEGASVHWKELLNN